MIICPKCNKELNDDSKFCNDCGAKITISQEAIVNEEMIINDEVVNNEEPIVNEEAVINKEPFNSEETITSKGISASGEIGIDSKKKLTKKSLISAGIIGVAAMVLIFLSVIWGEGKLNLSYVFYLKDDELNYTTLKKVSPIEITSNLINEKIEHKGIYSLTSNLVLSKDGKKVFYPSKVAEDYDNRDIYYRYLDDVDKTPAKIDSDIEEYVVSDNGNIVTYIKGDDNILYQSDLNDKVKIASNVSIFYVTSDGKKIVYEDWEDNIYYKDGTNDKEKISSSAEINFVSYDLSTIYYIADDILYKKQVGKEKVKIASDVKSLIKVYETGEVYFVKNGPKDENLMNYIDDDMQESDSKLTKPEEIEFPSVLDYNTYDDYYNAVDEYKISIESYEKEEEVYNEKLERDEIRENLKSKSASNYNSSLCFYNGTETITIAENVDRFSVSYEVADERAVIVYSTHYLPLYKVKMSDIYGKYDAEKVIEAGWDYTAENHIAIGDKTVDIDAPYERVIINSKGTRVFYLSDYDEYSVSGDLYQIEIANTDTDQVTEEPEKYDTDVGMIGFRFLTDDEIMYYKNNTGALYVNKMKIEDYVRTVSYCEATNSIAYITDWDSEKEYGTLKIFNQKESIEIANEVHEYTLNQNGDIVYMKDYSLKYSRGELHLYNKSKKSKKIADDVNQIISLYNWNTDKYGYYN